MSIIIFKFKLEIKDLQTVEIPNLLGILSVTTQGEDLVLYARVTVEAEDEFIGKVEVQIRGTGNMTAILSTE